MRVDFMIIGAQKCGTSSLAFQLAQHPQICFCRRKEPQYFSTTRDWRSGLGRYHRLFSPIGEQLCGEASTSYTFLPQYPGTHQRLYEYNPELKLIYIMRHPVERIVSQYTHDLLSGRCKATPEDIVLDDPSYMSRSSYATQMQSCLELFPRRNVLLLIFEEYVSSPKRTLDQMARFLAIDSAGFETIDTTPQNVSTGKGHLKRFPQWRLARSLIYRLPKPVQDLGFKLLRGPGHRSFYRVAEAKIEFPAALRQRVSHLLEDEIRGIEELMGRRLSAFRR